MSPGVHDTLDEQTYHADPDSLSASGMKLLLKDPALYRWAQDNPQPHRDAFDVGTAAHTMVLGTGANVVPIDVDSKRGKAWSEPADAAREQGAVPLLRSEYERVCAMADAVLSNNLARQILTGGKSEVSAFWLDPEWDVVRRARFDHLNPPIIGDLKTTVDSDPRELGKVVDRYGYDLQAAQYLDVANGLGPDVTAFGLVFVRKEPPHIVTVAELDDSFLDLGRAKIRIALERYRDCLASGVWVGHDPDTIHTLTPPRWAYADLEKIA